LNHSDHSETQCVIKKTRREDEFLDLRFCGKAEEGRANERDERPGSSKGVFQVGKYGPKSENLCF
jgi:hypothetical protein